MSGFLRSSPRVAVIGSGRCDKAVEEAASAFGRHAARKGWVVVCGGKGGVMEAACRGVQEENGISIGLLPGRDIREANPFVTVPVATGLGEMRNFLVVLNSDIVAAIEGGDGTLSEIGLARKIGRTVIALGAWSRLPGVLPASTPEELVFLVERFLLSGHTSA